MSMWSGMRTPTSSCVSGSVLILTTVFALALTEAASPNHLACVMKAFRTLHPGISQVP